MEMGNLEQEMRERSGEAKCPHCEALVLKQIGVEHRYQNMYGILYSWDVIKYVYWKRQRYFTKTEGVL